MTRCPRCAGRILREQAPEGGTELVCLSCGFRAYLDQHGAPQRPAPYAPTHEPRPAGQYVPLSEKTKDAHKRAERRAG